MKHLLVFSTVIITLISSLILDYTAETQKGIDIFVLFSIGVVFSINVFKFFIWGLVHKKYEVSASYPLTSIFFPIIYFVGYLQGETNLSYQKLLGILLIMFGLIIFEKKRRVI